MRPIVRRARPFATTLAAGTLAILAGPENAMAIMVPINHASRIDVRGVAASVVVGNPNIASVTVVDTHTLYIMGRSAGSTNVVVLDKSGRTLFTQDVTVSTLGDHVSLYRGERRVQVSCSYGCVELSDGESQPDTNVRATAPNQGAGAGATAAAPVANHRGPSGAPALDAGDPGRSQP